MEPNAPSIKTILFDLGNVLLDFSHERMLQQVSKVFGSTSEQVAEIVFGNQQYVRFDRGEISETEFQRLIESKLGATCETSRLQRAVGDIFTPKPEMRQLLIELKELGLRLVLLSNTCVTHINWIESHFDILELFDACVLSYEVGACKPDPKIFEAAIVKIECAPKECFYTDDIEKYVIAAKAFGLRSEIFTDESRLRKVLAEYGIQLRNSESQL